MIHCSLFDSVRLPSSGLVLASGHAGQASPSYTKQVAPERSSSELSEAQSPYVQLPSSAVALGTKLVAAESVHP